MFRCFEENKMENTISNSEDDRESLPAGCSAALLNCKERKSDISISDRLDYTDLYSDDENANSKYLDRSFRNNDSNLNEIAIVSSKSKKSKVIEGKRPSKGHETPDIFDLIVKSKQRKHQTHSQQTSKSLSLLIPPTRDDTDELLIAAHRASKAKKKSKIVNTKTTLNKEVITENTVHCKSSGQSDAEGEQGIFDLASLVISIAEKKKVHSKSKIRNLKSSFANVTDTMENDSSCSRPDIFGILATLPEKKLTSAECLEILREARANIWAIQGPKTLYNWTVCLHNGHLCVKGHASGGGRRILCRTSKISSVDKTGRTVMTSSGTYYHLSGKMSTSNSIPENISSRFSDGFPPDWHEIKLDFMEHDKIDAGDTFSQTGASFCSEKEDIHSVSSFTDPLQLAVEITDAPLSDDLMKNPRNDDEVFIKHSSASISPQKTPKENTKQISKSTSEPVNRQANETLKKSPAVSLGTEGKKAVSPDTAIFQKPRKITRVSTIKKMSNQTKPLDLDCSYITRSGRIVKPRKVFDVHVVSFCGEHSAIVNITTVKKKISKSRQPNKKQTKMSEMNLLHKNKNTVNKPDPPAIKKKAKAAGSTMTADKDACRGNRKKGKAEKPKTPTARRLEPESPILMKNPRKEKADTKRKGQRNKNRNNSTTIRPLYKERSIEDKEEVTKMYMASRNYRVPLTPLKLTPETLQNLQERCLESISHKDYKHQGISTKAMLKKSKANKARGKFAKKSKNPPGGKKIVEVVTSEEKENTNGKAKTEAAEQKNSRKRMSPPNDAGPEEEPIKKKRWTKKQKTLLSKMVDEEQNWSTIAEQLKCSEDECGTVYDSLFAKQTRKRASSKEVDPKTVQITARRGTIKHREQVRQKLEYLKKPTEVDDMFGDEPGMFAEDPICDDRLSDTTAPKTPSSRLPGFSMINFTTPAHFKTPSQSKADVMVCKTPQWAAITPSHLKGTSDKEDYLINRKQADRIAVQMGKKMKVGRQSQLKNNSPHTKERVKTKRKAIHINQDLFRRSVGENQIDLDSGEEEDYYFNEAS